MMKSFFKKLAFVMALAMVVTAMAPAATASAAETLGIALQTATSKTEVKTADNVAVGATVDYKYYGAPANYMDLEPTWSTSDEKIATVTQKGEVTGVADGVATITIALNDGTKGTIEITVGKGAEASKAFEVKQLEANKLQLTFADKASATKDISVEKVVESVNTTMVWVLNSAKTTLDGNVVTIEPWVGFGEATYKITANGVTEEYTTSVGAPAEVELKYEKPYPYAAAKNPAEAKVKVYDAKGVAVAEGSYTKYFELVKAEPAGYAYVNGNDGDLYFYADNAYAEVKVTIQYKVGTELKKIEQVFPVETKPMPVITMNQAFETVAVITKGADADKTVWGSSEVRIGSAKNYQVVGLIKNSAGDSFAVNEASVGTAKNNKTQLTGYELKYESTDSSKVLVHPTTGELVGVNQGGAYVLVSMRKLEKDAQWNIVAAVPVTVNAKSAADYVTLDKNFAVLLTSGDHATVKVTPQTYNNYNEKMDDTIKSVVAVFNNYKHELAGVDGAKDFTIDAEEANKILNAGQIKSTQFTYKVTMTSGKTTDFTLTIKDTPDPAQEEFKISATGAVVKADKLGEKVTINVVSEVLGEKYLDKDFYYGKVDASVATAGALYVVVLDKDLKPVTPATTASLVANKKFEAAAVTNTSTGTALTTLTAGNYAVQLYKVIDVVNGVVVDTMIDSTVYVVDNQLPTNATDVKVDLTKKISLTNKTISGAIDFKVNGDQFSKKASLFKVVSIEAATVPGTTKAYVYSVTVNYTIGDYYIKVVVPVGQTFDIQ